VSSPQGTLVFVEDTQREGIRKAGGKFDKRGIIKTNKLKQCRFQHKDGFCELHAPGLKPLSCFISPFMLNKNDTLLIRNRYKLLKCYNAGAKLPAYKAFRSGIESMFGYSRAKKFIDKVMTEKSDFYYEIEDWIYNLMKNIDGNWHENKSNLSKKISNARSLIQ